MHETALVEGVPNLRWVHASRTAPGPADVDDWITDALDALTRPLSEEEKRSGEWHPDFNRYIFEGTMDEAEEFFNQTEWIPHPVNAPITRFTDGLPVTIPTEERVARMLKGTSHKPDEILIFQADRGRRKRVMRYCSCLGIGQLLSKKWLRAPLWPAADRNTYQQCWQLPNLDVRSAVPTRLDTGSASAAHLPKKWE